MEKHGIDADRIFRKCRICGKVKPLDDFNKNGSNYRTECRDCKKDYERRQYQKNKDRWAKNYRENREKYAENHKKWRAENKEYLKEKNRQWYLDNKDYVKAYREANKEHIAKTSKKYREKNKDYLRQLALDYRAKNPHYYTEYEKRRAAVDPLYKFKKQIRNNIWHSFNRQSYKKNGHTAEIVGCDAETLVKHLKDTYKQNYGIEWNGIDTVHIDHIIPLATATNEQEIMALCYYTNLQLLKPKDNLAKGAKIA